MTKNVSLPAELAEWAERQAQQRMHPTFSSFVCDLLRKEAEREIGEDVAFLEQHAPPDQEPPGEDYWREFYADVRKRRKEQA